MLDATPTTPPPNLFIKANYHLIAKCPECVGTGGATKRYHPGLCDWVTEFCLRCDGDGVLWGVPAEVSA